MEEEEGRYNFSHLLHGGGRWKIHLSTSAIWRWKKEDTTSHICYMEVDDGRYNMQDLLYGGGRRKIQLPRSVIWRWKMKDTISHFCNMGVEDARYIYYFCYKKDGRYNFSLEIMYKIPK